MIRTTLTAMMLLTAAPAIAADRFDLDCSGQRRWSAEGADSPVTAHYRVDLVAKRWCRDDCALVAPIVSATPARVVFVAKAATPTEPDAQDEAVDLASGAWRDLFVGAYPPGDYWQSTGTCKLAPFTALPG
jgi:hypothetical protein